MERDAKQVMIVRQSSLKMAQEWAQSCGYCLDLVELVTLSEVISDYVIDGPQKGVMDRIRSVKTHFINKSNENK